MSDGHILNSVRLWAGLTAGLDQEVLLVATADGGFGLVVRSGNASIDFPMKPSQVHEVLSQRPVSLAAGQGAAELTPRGGVFEVGVTGPISATFSMPLDRFGILAKSLGLPPPGI